MPGVPWSDPWERASVWRLWGALIPVCWRTVPAQRPVLGSRLLGPADASRQGTNVLFLGPPHQTAPRWVCHTQDSISQRPESEVRVSPGPRGPRGLAPSGDTKAGQASPGSRWCGHSQTCPSSPCLCLHVTSLSRVTLQGQSLDWAHPVQYDHRLANHSCKHRCARAPPCGSGRPCAGGPQNRNGAHSLLMTHSPLVSLFNFMSKRGWTRPGPRECCSAGSSRACLGGGRAQWAGSADLGRPASSDG